MNFSMTTKKTTLVIPGRFALLQSISTNERFITMDHQNLILMEDGSIGYKVLEYAFDLKEAQSKLDKLNYPWRYRER